jgi:acyl-CoA synthetase (AMP-forming)/AMP-acid ligase II
VCSEGGVIKEDDVAVLFLPLFHVYGLVVTFLASLVFGNKMVVMETFNLNDYLQFCDKYKVRCYGRDVG